MLQALRALLFPVWCIGCGRPDVAICGACVPERDVVASVAGVPLLGLATYEGLVQKAIVRMKSGERAYLDAFASLLAARIPASLPVIPVPTTRGRRAERGFDQSLELARRYARACGVEVCEALRKRRGPAQQGRSRDRRLRSGGRYRLEPVTLPPTAVLLDDVTTTGATFFDALITVRTAGVEIAACVALAVAERDAETTSGTRRNGERSCRA